MDLKAFLADCSFIRKTLKQLSGKDFSKPNDFDYIELHLLVKLANAINEEIIKRLKKMPKEKQNDILKEFFQIDSINYVRLDNYKFINGKTLYNYILGKTQPRKRKIKVLQFICTDNTITEVLNSNNYVFLGYFADDKGIRKLILSVNTEKKKAELITFMKNSLNVYEFYTNGDVSFLEYFTKITFISHHSGLTLFLPRFDLWDKSNYMSSLYSANGVKGNFFVSGKIVFKRLDNLSNKINDILTTQNPFTVNLSVANKFIQVAPKTYYEDIEFEEINLVSSLTFFLGAHKLLFIYKDHIYIFLLTITPDLIAKVTDYKNRVYLGKLEFIDSLGAFCKISFRNKDTYYEAIFQTEQSDKGYLIGTLQGIHITKELIDTPILLIKNKANEIDKPLNIHLKQFSNIKDKIGSISQFIELLTNEYIKSTRDIGIDLPSIKIFTSNVINAPLEQRIIYLKILAGIILADKNFADTEKHKLEELMRIYKIPENRTGEIYSALSLTDSVFNDLIDRLDKELIKSLVYDLLNMSFADNKLTEEELLYIIKLLKSVSIA